VRVIGSRQCGAGINVGWRAEARSDYGQGQVFDVQNAVAAGKEAHCKAGLLLLSGSVCWPGAGFLSPNTGVGRGPGGSSSGPRVPQAANAESRIRWGSRRMDLWNRDSGKAAETVPRHGITAGTGT